MFHFPESRFHFLRHPCSTSSEIGVQFVRNTQLRRRRGDHAPASAPRLPNVRQAHLRTPPVLPHPEAVHARGTANPGPRLQALPSGDVGVGCRPHPRRPPARTPLLAEAGRNRLGRPVVRAQERRLAAVGTAMRIRDITAPGYYARRPPHGREHQDRRQIRAPRDSHNRNHAGVHRGAGAVLLRPADRSRRRTPANPRAGRPLRGRRRLALPVRRLRTGLRTAHLSDEAHATWDEARRIARDRLVESLDQQIYGSATVAKAHGEGTNG